MKSKLTLTLIAAASMLGTLPLAAQAQSNTLEGVYIGGSLGGSRLHGNDAPGLDRSDTGWKGYAGYEFTPNIALELGYVDLGEFSSSVGTYKVNGPFLDAVGKYRFAPQWQGLVRAGLFQSKLDAPGLGSDRGTGFKVGAGVQYDITQNLGVRGEYERYRVEAFDQNPKVDLFSVGLNLKF
jgi:OOP family OmpA-OmpF porin